MPLVQYCENEDYVYNNCEFVAFVTSLMRSFY